MNIELLIFDLDGTLIDSAHDIAAATNRLLIAHGKEPIPTNTITSHIGEGLKPLVLSFFQEYDGDEKKLTQIMDEYISYYDEEMYNTTRPFPGAENFLNQWDGEIAIVTNKNIRSTQKIMSHLSLNKYSWLRVFGSDSLREKKPHPLPLLEVMKAAEKNPNQTLMIGDGTPDMKSAHAANVASVAIGFGYTHIDKLKQYNPVAVLEHYDELFDLIRGL